MWKLNPEDIFLFFKCDPELVVYNKLTRSTSLIPPSIVLAYKIFQDNPSAAVSSDTLFHELKERQNNVVEICSVESYIEHLCQIDLIVKL